MDKEQSTKNQHDEQSNFSSQMFHYIRSENSLKLQAAILFFVTKFPGRMNRILLCKHLYYMDGHFFQKFGKTITGFLYLHIEGSPQPVCFNEIMQILITEKKIEVIPFLETENRDEGIVFTLKGLTFKPIAEIPDVFDREEKKVMNSIASTLGGDLSLETRFYPNLYQEYAQTGLYEKIEMKPFAEGKRPHLQWKAWANRIFRLKWQ